LSTENVLSITDVAIDPELQDGRANIWMSIEVTNTADDAATGLLTVVVEHESARETLELTEEIEPGKNAIEAVVRVEDADNFEYSEANGARYTCMVGLRHQGKVQSVIEKHFVLPAG